MPSSGSDSLSRRIVLGALAAMPALSGLLDATAAEAQTGAPLASWNDGPAKQAILDFVRVTTDSSSKDFCRQRSASPNSTRTARSGSSTRCTRRSCFASTMSAT